MFLSRELCVSFLQCLPGEFCSQTTQLAGSTASRRSNMTPQLPDVVIPEKYYPAESTDSWDANSQCLHLIRASGNCRSGNAVKLL